MTNRYSTITTSISVIQNICIAVKNPLANAGDPGSIPGSGGSPGMGNGNPPQYSCLKSSLDRGAWWTIVHGVTKSWMCLMIHTHKVPLGHSAAFPSRKPSSFDKLRSSSCFQSLQLCLLRFHE